MLFAKKERIIMPLQFLAMISTFAQHALLKKQDIGSNSAQGTVNVWRTSCSLFLFFAKMRKISGIFYAVYIIWDNSS
jgi:hypothetical protein